MNEGTYQSVQIELARAKEKHPHGADLPCLIRAVGNLASALIQENRAHGPLKHAAGPKSRA